MLGAGVKSGNSEGLKKQNKTLGSRRIAKQPTASAFQVERHVFESLVSYKQ